MTAVIVLLTSGILGVLGVPWLANELALRKRPLVIEFDQALDSAAILVQWDDERFNLPSSGYVRGFSGKQLVVNIGYERTAWNVLRVATDLKTPPKITKLLLDGAPLEPLTSTDFRLVPPFWGPDRSAAACGAILFLLVNALTMRATKFPAGWTRPC